jgi:hypothetical protein
LLTLIISLTLISGCSSVKQLEIFTKEVERTPLNLEGPGPLKMEEVEWIIVTEENYKKVFDELRKNNKDVVVFGLTDDNYEILSMNFAQVRNYIILQGNVLKKYKEYYENGTEETSSGK